MRDKNTDKIIRNMSNSQQLLHPNARNKLPPTNTPPPSTNEATPSPLLQPMCWFLLITIVFWLNAALIITVTILYITRNPVNASIFAPLASPAYFLYSILKPMLPMDEKRFTISKMKIQKPPKVV